MSNVTKIELKYDPFKIESILSINGEVTGLSECWGTGKDVRLCEYIDKFFPAVIEKFHLSPASNCEVQFYGPKDAFEELQEARDKYRGDVKIKPPGYKPYPHNFHEMNILIDEKRKDYAKQIEHKKRVKSNVEFIDVVKQFGRDKDTIERIYRDNLEKTKERFGSLSFDKEEKEKAVKKPAAKKRPAIKIPAAKKPAAKKRPAAKKTAAKKPYLI